MKKSLFHLFFRIRFPILLILFFAINFVNKLHAQTLCMPAVPSYTINLTGQPEGVWSSPNIPRTDQCCSASSSDECVFFNLTLDPRSAGIQIDMIGADPPGSLFYDINCTGSYPGGTIKCIEGSGPHLITFCKPGKNKNVYKITSISKPLFPPDDTVRIGCKKRLNTLGIVNNTTIWQSISPGSPGAYDHYLDSTHIASPLYTPQAGAPAYVDYKVCGFPVASGCGFNFTICDTVRIYNYPTLNVSANPNPASFCNLGSGSGVSITGSSTGGLPTYNYYWYNQSNTLVGTGATFFASAAGNYKLESRDRLYSPSFCPSAFTTVSVTQGSLPIVDAGPNQKLCASSPVASLSGTKENASGVIWSGGSGTYNPGNTYLNTSYTPTTTEISNGFVKLYLTSTGAGGGCTNSKDSVLIYFSPLISVDIVGNPLLCHNSSTILTATISGGTAPFFYQWNTGSMSSSINANEGAYSVTVLDSIGCKARDELYLSAPSSLNINFNSVNANPDGSSTGSASVNVSGGTVPYSITWNPTGLHTSTISNLPYGVYTASIIDANGCIISGSTVVNEPRCFNFIASVLNTQLNCTGDQNAIATVLASGGTPPYTYQWNTNPVQTNDTAFNLGAGVYSVLISDANSCFQTANTVITEPSTLTTTITHQDVTTSGGNNGSAIVYAFGGTIPYSYLWSNTVTTSTNTGLIAGTYTVRVTDQKGCIKRDSVIITQPPCNDYNVNVITSNVSCYGGNNGSALAVIGGISGTYTVNWSNGANGPSISGLIAGNYSVSVTDSKNCTSYFNFSIVQPPRLSVSLIPTNISCYGKNNGTIELTVSGGTFPYTFNWSNTSTAEDLIDLSAGTYSVFVSDTKGCSSSASTVISEPLQIAATYSVQNVSCIYGNNGSINLSVSGGRSPYVFNWSNGSSTEDLSNLTAGGYSVTIKDANNCIMKEQLIIPIAQPDSVKVDSFIVACSVPGSGTTQVTIIPTGGSSGTFQVSLNNGPFGTPGNYSFLLNNNTTYVVTLKDLNNCVSLKPDTLLIKGEVKIDSVAFNKCFSLGTTQTPVHVYPSGGNDSPYSVSYNNGVIYQSPGVYTNNLNIANSYLIIVRDNRNCVSAIKSIQIPAILSVNAQVTSIYHGEDISCFGANDGIAQASTTGGTGVYSYSWSTQPIQLTATANQLVAGTYTVTVKDENNCQDTVSITLKQPDQLTATASITSDYNGTNISCFGYQDGAAEVIANGGTGTYTYSWYTILAQTTDSVVGLSAGTYTIIIKDENNCSVTRSVTLTQPASITANLSITSNYNGQAISCYGEHDANLMVVASNGVAPYTYEWSSNSIVLGNSLLGVGAGTYSVTVKDANECAIIKSIQVNQPTQLIANAFVISDNNGYDISCFGTNDGIATSTATGGTGNYTFLWLTVPTQANDTAHQLSAGTYTVNVKDINECLATATVILQQPLAMNVTATVTSNYHGEDISCFGANDGIAQASTSGGTGVYFYSWSTQPAQLTATANQFVAGTYTVTVKDENNCSATASVTLQQPDQLTATASITSDYNGTNISCFGYQDGAAEVIANGGTGTYTYSWYTIPAQTTDSVVGLSAGTFTVIVIDENNCSVTRSVTLTQPASITANLSITSNYNGQAISCYGEHDANLMVVASNGVAPYTYEWSSNSIVLGNMLIGVGAGTFSVTVKDANECTVIKSIQVEQPSQLIANAFVISDNNGYDISCFGGNDGIATSTATGGTGNYTYLWLTVPAQANDTAHQLSAGTYTVNVRDINECLATATVTLQQPLAMNVTAIVTSNYHGEDISCFGANDGIAQTSTSGGTGVYFYSWSTQPAQLTATANQLVAGTYTVTVKDENNCSATASVTLQQPDQLTATVSITSDYNGSNISCFGYQDGAAEVVANGGTGSYSYSWNSIPVQNTDSVTGLSAGTYSVIVVDINKCSVINTIVLTQPTAVTATLTITSNYNGQAISCYGEHDANLMVVASNGVAPYTYEWSSNSIVLGNMLIGVGAGTFSVTVKDANECTVIKSIQIEQPSQLLASIAIISDFNGYDISCFGSNDGIASATATGGTGTYIYQWTTNPVQQNGNAINLSAGTYQVIVEDANQCEAVATVTLNQPDQLTISVLDISDFNNYNISCYGSNDGYIDIAVQGGVDAYQYNWSNGASSQDVTQLIAGNYSVIVKDANNCTTQLNIELQQPNQLLASIDSVSNYNGFNVSCNGSDDGFILVTVFGGVSAYNYVWSNNTSNEDLYNAEAGTYQLLITDANKCTQSISMNLVQPSAISVSTIKVDPLCFGLNTGSVDVSISGGAGNYIYSWSNGSQTQDLESLLAGNYTLNYNDINNCNGTVSVTINQPEQLKIEKNIEPIACYGDSLGNILTAVSGGVLPYNYSWSNDYNGNNLINIPAGFYVLVVKDANACIIADTTLLTQPDSLYASVYSPLYFNGHHVTLNNAYDGSIDLTVNGGIGDYNYLWSNGETSEDITQLHAGTYYVTIIDANDCRISTSIVLTEPYVLEMPEGFSPNDDGKNDNFIIHGIESYPNNNLKIFNRWGNIVYQKDNYLNNWHGENTDGKELPDATYFAILEINNGDIVLKGYVEIRKK